MRDVCGLTMSLVLLLGLALTAQTPPYTDRAKMAADPAFQSRVGIAVQQQAILAMGENPDVCCQATTQSSMALKPGTKELCAVTITGGTPGASDLVKARSRERHQARQRFAAQTIANPDQWARSLAGIVAADNCIPLDVTDAAIQSYLIRLWDIVALPPELANAIVVTTPAAPPIIPPPTQLKVPPKPPPEDR